MNVKPKNYNWADFYDKVIDLPEYAFHCMWWQWLPDGALSHNAYAYLQKAG